MKRIAIMQPYFLPYIGYFQLMNTVDEFVIYDNIEFSRKGWVNRNRILVNGVDMYVTLPLKKDSDYLDIIERSLAETWPVERKKMLNRIKESYRNAPHFNEVFPVIEELLLFEETNLFRFLFNTLQRTKDYLGIKTALTISSTLHINHELRSEDKVLVMAQSRNSDVYINPIGGIELYNKQRFREMGIELLFLKTDNFTYDQNKMPFIPFLSIIDVMMFNSQEKIRDYLLRYSLL